MYARFPKWTNLRSLSWNNLDIGSGSLTTTLGWNLWTLSDLLTIAGVDMADSTTAAAVWTTGADLVLTLELDCNLDGQSGDAVLQKQCSPTWDGQGSQLFQPVSETSKAGRIYRLDTASSLSQGANRRFTTLLMGGGDDVAGSNSTRRTLTKAYGVKMQVLLTGVGRKFDATETATHVGAGLALFGIATAVVDMLAVYVFPRRAFYSAHKYEQVDGDARAAPVGAAGAGEGEEESEDEEEGEAGGGEAEGRATRRRSLLEQPLLPPS